MIPAEVSLGSAKTNIIVFMNFSNGSRYFEGPIKNSFI